MARNLWGNISDTMMSPLFLGGAALVSGEGMGGAMRGMQMGSEFDAQRRKQAETDRLNTAAQQLYADPNFQKSLPSGMGQLVQVMGPKGLGYAADVLAKNYMTPLDTELKRADIDYRKAMTARAIHGENRADTPEARALAAQKFGLDPNSEAARAYILTGRLPREDQQALTATDKKAILEADDMVSANQTAISALEEAQKISPVANQGWFAGTRAALGNNLKDWMVPDFISSPKSSEATSNLDNAVIGNAVTQLKTIFGGNPTEGERKILIDLQGSSSQSDNVRQEIYARAIGLAKKRLEFNQQRATQLRGGTYYKTQPQQTKPTQKSDPLGIR